MEFLLFFILGVWHAPSEVLVGLGSYLVGLGFGFLVILSPTPPPSFDNLLPHLQHDPATATATATATAPAPATATATAAAPATCLTPATAAASATDAAPHTHTHAGGVSAPLPA